MKNQLSGIEQFLSSVPVTSDTKFLDTSTAEHSHLINDLIYYMNYALASFGWPLHLIENPCIYCCICPYLSPSRCCRSPTRKGKHSESLEKCKNNSKVKQDEKSKKQKNEEEENEEEEGDKIDVSNNSLEDSQNQNQGAQIDQQDALGSINSKNSHQKLYTDFEGPIILGDNCFGCNIASVENRLSSHNYEIIYVSYKVNINIVPFLVVADHSKQTIVVAIRGSMSLSDMVTDLNGQTEKLPIDDCPDDWISHRGMTRAALYIKSKLSQEYILEHAFNCRPDLGSRDYNLILCGHSLGAGAAAILGILLRKQYPTLKAYLYSPPGGLLSLPVVEHTKEFATGIVLGNDCVPRLGFAQLERLRYHVLLSLKRSTKSTGKIIAKALCPTICMGGNKVEYDPEYSMDILYGSSGRTFDYNGNKIVFQAQPSMLYVPGRIIHIVKNFTFKSKARRLFNEPIYQAIWMENTSYDRIMVNEGMFYDHLPNMLMHSMKMLFYSTLPARKELKSLQVDNVHQHKNPDSLRDNDNDDSLDSNRELRTIKVIAEASSVVSDDNEDVDNNNKLDENNNNINSEDLGIVIYPDLNKDQINCERCGSEKVELKSRYDLNSKKTDINEYLDINGNNETVPNQNLSEHNEITSIESRLYTKNNH